jgi:hypothetical protein
MNDDNAGMAIEGFVQQAYGRMFVNKIDRHHPLVAWADYRVAGSETNFAETKASVLTTLAALQHTLHHDRAVNNVEVLNALGDVEARLLDSKNLTHVGSAIREANELLNRTTTGQ